MNEQHEHCRGCRKLSRRNQCEVVGRSADMRVVHVCRRAGWKAVWVHNLKKHTSGGDWAAYLEGR
jgi:hypothetical protein